MIIHLTDEQSRALSQGTPLELTATGGDSFFLLSAEQYSKVRTLLDDDIDVRSMTPYMAKIFGDAGWNDPEMDAYDELDPRRQS